ncbi:MAG TPA: hypothetical protein VF478_07055 [Anaerolineae bacterium]
MPDKNHLGAGSLTPAAAVTGEIECARARRRACAKLGGTTGELSRPNRDVGVLFFQIERFAQTD